MTSTDIDAELEDRLRTALRDWAAEAPVADRGIDATDARSGVLGRLRPAWLAVAGAVDHRHRLAERGERGCVADREPGAGVGDHPSQLAGGRGRVHRHRDGLRPEGSEVRRDELDPVAERDQHALTGDHSCGADPGGEVTERRV